MLDNAHCVTHTAFEAHVRIKFADVISQNSKHGMSYCERSMLYTCVCKVHTLLLEAMVDSLSLVNADNCKKHRAAISGASCRLQPCDYFINNLDSAANPRQNFCQRFCSDVETWRTLIYAKTNSSLSFSFDLQPLPF